MNYNKPINSKNIVITGGTGFVGSHLAKRLYYNSNIAFVFDNFFTGKKSNSHKVVNYKNAETKDIYWLHKNIELNYIYHLGEYSRAEQSLKDIYLLLKYNSFLFFEVLKLATHLHAKLIYSGLSTKFSQNLDQVESPYSYTKRKNTEFLKQYAKWYKLKYAITFFYNVYGEKEIAQGKCAIIFAHYTTRYILY